MNEERVEAHRLRPVLGDRAGGGERDAVGRALDEGREDVARIERRAEFGRGRTRTGLRRSRTLDAASSDAVAGSGATAPEPRTAERTATSTFSVPGTSSAKICSRRSA
jgi:hypothetical protein